MKQRKINNFLNGTNLINLFPPPTSYKEIKLNLLSDEEAVMQDWQVIGNDLRVAVDKVMDDERHNKQN